MDKLVPFNESNLNSLLKKRSDESKFGEHITLIPQTTDIYEQLLNLDVKYIVFGIPEDVGVFANLGKTGTSSAWNACLKVLLNIQSNKFTQANSVLILGYLDFSDEIEKMYTLDQTISKDVQKARKLVKIIDAHVTELMSIIIRAGKTPIVIGGGHNNAYGNIKGTSLALKKPINVINFDAHSDFRTEEGRHSGNGFSYAYSEGFLKKYFIFGLHENYTSEAIFKQLEGNMNIEFNTFESIEVRKERKFKPEIKRALQHINSKPYGIELDCDAITNISSSAMTPSGFSVSKTREFLNSVAKSKQAMYLHLCEASPTKENEVQVGKLLTYLITDFIRAHANA